MTATLERRKEVLQLAREHNFIILEGKSCHTLPMHTHLPLRRRSVLLPVFWRGSKISFLFFPGARRAGSR